MEVGKEIGRDITAVCIFGLRSLICLGFKAFGAVDVEEGLGSLEDTGTSMEELWAAVDLFG